jgi:hypothetical protein
VCELGYLPPNCTSTCPNANMEPPACTTCLAHLQPPDCVCAVGYGGANCTEFSCSKIDDCHADSGHGICIGANRCYCLMGYSGDSCDTAATLPLGASIAQSWYIDIAPAPWQEVPLGVAVHLVADLLDRRTGQSVLREVRPQIQWACSTIDFNQASSVPCEFDSGNAALSSERTQTVRTSAIGTQAWSVTMSFEVPSTIENSEQAVVEVQMRNTSVVVTGEAALPELTLTAFPSRVISYTTSLVLTGTLMQQSLPRRVLLWQWRVEHGQVDGTMVRQSDGALQSSIVIEATAISSYNTTFVLEVTLEGQLIVEQAIQIFRFRPPINGQCDVVPTVGMELATKFRFSCWEWTTPHAHLLSSNISYAVTYTLPSVSGALEALATMQCNLEASSAVALDAYLPQGAANITVRVSANNEQTHYTVPGDIVVTPYMSGTLSAELLQPILDEADTSTKYYEQLELYQILAALAGQHAELPSIARVAHKVEQLLTDYPPTPGTLAQYILTLDKLASNPTLSADSVQSVIPVVLSASRAMTQPEYQHIPAQLALLQAISALASRLDDSPPNEQKYSKLLRELWEAIDDLQWSMVRFVPNCGIRSDLLIDSNSRIAIRSGIDSSSVLQEGHMTLTDEFPSSFDITEEVARLLGIPQPTDCAVWYMTHVEPLFFAQPVPGAVCRSML